MNTQEDVKAGKTQHTREAEVRRTGRTLRKSKAGVS